MDLLWRHQNYLLQIFWNKKKLFKLFLLSSYLGDIFVARAFLAAISFWVDCSEPLFFTRNFYDLQNSHHVWFISCYFSMLPWKLLLSFIIASTKNVSFFHLDKNKKNKILLLRRFCCYVILESFYQNSLKRENTHLFFFDDDWKRFKLNTIMHAWFGKYFSLAQKWPR